MKAIVTKYHGPGNVRGSRISASDCDHNKVILSVDNALGIEDNHDRAAWALCKKMGWTEHNLMRGGMPNGDIVYVFDAHVNRLRKSRGERLTAA